MSLDQYTADGRRVIDLTNGPVIDLTKASYFSPDRAELEEAANRLLLSQLGQQTPAPFGAAAVPGPAWQAERPAARRGLTRGLRINVMSVLKVSVVASFGLLLMGLVVRL